MSVVLLDNEAVTAMLDPAHRKHRLMVAHMQAVTGRKRRGAPDRVVVATAVRVEAGWNRTRAESAALNRYRVQDAPLDARAADRAAEIVTRTGVSVADAHTGATAQVYPAGQVVVLTSDPKDMVAAAAPVDIRTVLI